MKPLYLLLLPILIPALIRPAWGQDVADKQSIGDLSSIIDQVDNFNRQLQFFRKNYDDYEVQQSLEITRELMGMGRQIGEQARGLLEAEIYDGKNEKAYLKAVVKNLGRINKSLDRLGQYINTQDYKRRSPQPGGGHSAIETEYFVKISNSIKAMNMAKKYLP